MIKYLHCTKKRDWQVRLPNKNHKTKAKYSILNKPKKQTKKKPTNTVISHVFPDYYDQMLVC